MNRFLFIIYFLFLVATLLSQSEFTFIEDMSGVGYSDRVEEMEVDQDTIYNLIIMKIDNPEYPGATLTCSGLLVMDNQGNELNRKQYPTIRAGENMLIEEDQIFITHGESVEQNGKHFITQIDKASLEVDTVYIYDTGLDILDSHSLSFQPYQDKYILGLSNLVNEANLHKLVGNYLVIDKESMEADTILYLPVEYETSFAYDIYEEDEDLVIYYVSNDTSGHGFIRLDSTYQIKDQHEDTYALGYGLNYWHQTLMRPNGDFIYTHLDFTRSDVFSLNPNFNPNWHTELPIPQDFNFFGMNIVNTSEGNLLITGLLQIQFESTQYDWIDLELNSGRDLPYVAMLDGETGNVIWHHFYIGVDEEGRTTYTIANDIIEVSNGDLYVGGVVKWRSQEPSTTDTGIFKLPADGCLNPHTGCHLYQFIDQILTSTEDELENDNAITITQLGDQVQIEIDPPNDGYTVLLTTSSGQVIHQSRQDKLKCQLSLTTFPPGVYFLSIVSNHGESLNTSKVMR